MTKRLTEREVAAVARLQEALKGWPKTLRLYSTDAGSITICNAGVPSNKFNLSIKAPINFGAILTDLHAADYNPHGLSEWERAVQIAQRKPWWKEGEDENTST